MEQILTHLPQFVLIVIAFLWAAEKFILPFFRQYGTVRQSETNIEQVKQELDALKAELEDWEVRYRQLDESYRALREKYSDIMGMLRGFQVYLKDKGMADFPMMDDLIKHANAEQ